MNISRQKRKLIVLNVPKSLISPRGLYFLKCAFIRSAPLCKSVKAHPLAINTNTVKLIPKGQLLTP